MRHARRRGRGSVLKRAAWAALLIPGGLLALSMIAAISVPGSAAPAVASAGSEGAGPPVAVAVSPEPASPAPDPEISPEEPAGPPDVVIILTDDQRWDTLEVMPTVEHQLVDKGTRFSNAFVSNSLCCPSRSSILTGTYSHTNGVYGNGPPYGGYPAFDPSSSLATWLTPTYQTALIGKYLNSGEEPIASGVVPPGWDHWVAFPSPAFLNYQLSIDGHLHTFGTDPEDYSTNVLADQAVDFIQGAKDDEPLFLYFAPFAPHRPAIPAGQDAHAFDDLPPWRPPSYNEADMSDKPSWQRGIKPIAPDTAAAVDEIRRDQLRTLLSVDRGVERILDALARTGRLHDTLVIFTSDNGYLWGEHRQRAKQVAYDESLRVPYVVRYDRLENPPAVDSHLVVNIDIAPTIAQAAGLDLYGVDGRSLFPLLTRSAKDWRDDFLIEHANKEDVPSYCGVRSERYKLVVYADGEEELYDLQRDPHEMSNVAGDAHYDDVHTELLHRLHKLCSPPPPGMRTP